MGHAPEISVFISIFIVWDSSYLSLMLLGELNEKFLKDLCKRLFVITYGFIKCTWLLTNKLRFYGDHSWEFWNAEIWIYVIGKVRLVQLLNSFSWSIWPCRSLSKLLTFPKALFSHVSWRKNHSINLRGGFGRKWDNSCGVSTVVGIASKHSNQYMLMVITTIIIHIPFVNLSVNHPQLFIICVNEGNALNREGIKIRLQKNPILLAMLLFILFFSLLLRS